MIGFNHAAVGGFTGVFLPLPIAIPAAIASHFVLDMLPHYGIPHTRRNEHFWRLFGITDFIVSWLLLGGTPLHRGHYAIFLCALAAASPDFIWVARIMRTKSFDLSQHKSRFAKWHASIQHWERPWGIFIEIPLAIVLGYFAVTTW
jgi:hypothetical protein